MTDAAIFERARFLDVSDGTQHVHEEDVVRVLGVEEGLSGRDDAHTSGCQLVEQEGSDSLTRLVLRVSPAVGHVDEEALKAALLTELGRGGLMDQHQAELLRRASSVIIERCAPLATCAGKVLPFHLERTAGRAPAHPAGPAPSQTRG